MTKAKLIQQNAKDVQLKLQEMNEREYLRSVDVVNLFSISNSTLRNLRNSGDLPCYKLGGTYLYKKSEIEACMVKLTNS